jgi:hypothetical protein
VQDDQCDRNPIVALAEEVSDVSTVRAKHQMVPGDSRQVDVERPETPPPSCDVLYG